MVNKISVITQDSHLWIYLVFITIVLVFSIVINKVLLSFSKNLGMRNSGEIRWAPTSKPSLGGISFFIAFLLSTTFASIVLDKQFASLQVLGITASCVVGFTMGLADDAYNTKPWLKFFAQFLSGVLLIITGTQIEIFNNDILNYIFTILWVVGIMNSINMLDNMDGITTTTSIGIILIGLMVSFSLGNGIDVYSILFLGVIASLFGFLKFNWNPSKMYMGDTGSQFLGALLSALGIMYFWNFHEQNEPIYESKKIIITILAFLVPISDTTTVTINRLAKGKSPFIGGRDHTTHHLSYLGITDANIARLYALLSFMSFVCVFLIVNVIEEWSLGYTFIFGLYCFLVFFGLYINTKISVPSKKVSRARKLVEQKQSEVAATQTVYISQKAV